ncbi:MAG: hypothetical protein WBY01_09765 [Pseudolabrys sp.]
MPLLTAFVHSDLTRWIPAAGIAEKTLVAPVVRTFLLTAAIGIAMLGIGLAFAIRMATTIARAETLYELLDRRNQSSREEHARHRAVARLTNLP